MKGLSVFCFLFCLASPVFAEKPLLSVHLNYSNVSNDIYFYKVTIENVSTTTLRYFSSGSADSEDWASDNEMVRIHPIPYKKNPIQPVELRPKEKVWWEIGMETTEIKPLTFRLRFHPRISEIEDKRIGPFWSNRVELQPKVPNKSFQPTLRAREPRPQRG